MHILQLALNASQKVVAVSAVHSLHLLDISNPAAPGQHAGRPLASWGLCLFGAWLCCLWATMPRCVADAPPASPVPYVNSLPSLRLLCPFPPTPPAVLTAPVVAAWLDGRKRATYHDIKWNEPLGLLYAAGKDKLVDMYTLG